MTVNEIYYLLGQKLSDQINGNWKEAFLQIMRAHKTVEFKCHYFDITNKKNDMAVSLGYKEAKAIHELHQITTEGGNNKWNRAILKLWPGGKFEMEFIWDQELHDEIERLSKE